MVAIRETLVSHGWYTERKESTTGLLPWTRLVIIARKAAAPLERSIVRGLEGQRLVESGGGS